MPVPKAAKLAKFNSTKPGLITTKDPIKPMITAIHLRTPTLSPKKKGDKAVTINGAMKAKVKALANEIIDIAENVNSKDDLLNSKIGSLSISDRLVEQTGIIGEKIEIGNFQKLSGKYIGGYVHAGNKIASLVALSDSLPFSEEVSKNVAMQVAAMNPLALDENSVDSSIVEKETEIIKEQLIKEGRPENIIDNIIVGKLKRFYKDNTLTNQSYIKDSKISVQDYVKSIDKDLSIKSFVRVSLF